MTGNHLWAGRTIALLVTFLIVAYLLNSFSLDVTCRYVRESPFAGFPEVDSEENLAGCSPGSRILSCAKGKEYNLQMLILILVVGIL